jgi:Tol biopolymer transport system component
VFDPQTDQYLGKLDGTDGKPIQIDGLWALMPGNQGANSDPNSIYFTAGLDGEQHGLFGSLTASVDTGDSASLSQSLLNFVESAASFGANGQGADPSTVAVDAAGSRFELVSKIAFTSSRDHFDSGIPLLNQGEIYLMDPDGSDLQRLTSNEYMDALPMLSPDGKKIVFDSNRFTTDLLTNPQTGEPILNISDLFVMDADGENETLLTRGSSATWSPDSKYIAFHASASYYTSGGTVTLSPAGDAPGAATRDSDIFVANVDDLAAAPDVLTRTQLATNITNTTGLREEDADWSPDGRSIVFTSRTPGDPAGSEIYVINPDGTARVQLTHNNYEERGPSWSPDGTRIAFSARIDGPDFEICVMNADGSGIQQLTNNGVGDLTPSWSPDGTQIAFHHFISPDEAEIFVMNADGSGIQQLTDTPGTNVLAQWGEVRTPVGSGDGDLGVETARDTFPSDGTQPATVALLGQYTAASFVGAAGAFGGTPTYDSPPAATLEQTLTQPLHS